MHRYAPGGGGGGCMHRYTPGGGVTYSCIADRLFLPPFLYADVIGQQDDIIKYKWRRESSWLCEIKYALGTPVLSQEMVIQTMNILHDKVHSGLNLGTNP